MGGTTDCRDEARPLTLSDDIKIRLRHVGKSFSVNGQRIQALQHVNLDVQAGEFCCIVGPSGCGKTTLLRILAGLERHSEGEVQIRQEDVARPLTAMVFQEQSVFPWMTVRDNVGYGLRRRGVPTAEVRDAVDYYVEKVGLHAFAAAYPHQLSGGMKQRVSIARAFANDPEILLMDEPFAALDEQNKSILQEELLRIWEESRKTVLFITHSIDEALVLGDRALVMTARPGTIKHDVVNTIPRPRGVYAMKSHSDYGALSALIWDHLRGEVQRAAAKSMERP
ncbi:MULTISPECIES: ABC transporter ATP-binding protein [unclassified Beijerinckia]|uniref:ABC transporter ATP-binding protein n=1 Tax=unclassified Beijerinckia TaxID=2638183 RepID=UPI000894CAB3|nr:MULTISPECIES: ABC transporter ATP-binding protein [unclassified Beijerinckia]MDH7799053.1 NitT/TauT family transport system ATP-binding protein [Beijerinckia sp. GAS462]SED96605.1 NitT/TauT family transport system ATP-binding protein [Beijerinckia sp. 28-YEA-48]